MKYKLLVLDIDGTSLKLGGQNLSPLTLSTLQKIQKMGIKILVNSGRVSIGVPKDFYNIPFSFLSSSNGAKVRDIENNVLLSENLIDNETAYKLYNYLDNSKSFYLTFINDDRYTTKKAVEKKLPTIRHNQRLVKGINQLDSLSKYIKENNYNVEKITIRYNPEDKDELYQNILSISDNLIITSGEYGNYEINNPKATKGNSLLQICQYMNIDVSQTIICGDNGNDVSMLKLNGFKIVPNNGTDEAKKYANVIADSCDNDGIAKALIELLELK